MRDGKQTNDMSFVNIAVIGTRKGITTEIVHLLMDLFMSR